MYPSHQNNRIINNKTFGHNLAVHISPPPTNIWARNKELYSIQTEIFPRRKIPISPMPRPIVGKKISFLPMKFLNIIVQAVLAIVPHQSINQLLYKTPLYV
jgi:hypothetical protein